MKRARIRYGFRAFEQLEHRRLLSIDVYVQDGTAGATTPPQIAWINKGVKEGFDFESAHGKFGAGVNPPAPIFTLADLAAIETFVAANLPIAVQPASVSVSFSSTSPQPKGAISVEFADPAIFAKINPGESTTNQNVKYKNLLVTQGTDPWSTMFDRTPPANVAFTNPLINLMGIAFSAVDAEVNLNATGNAIAAVPTKAALLADIEFKITNTIGHELGHLWGGQHVDGVLDPQFDWPGKNTFSAPNNLEYSLTRIDQTQRKTAAFLDNLLQNKIIKFGDFKILEKFSPVTEERIYFSSRSGIATPKQLKPAGSLTLEAFDTTPVLAAGTAVTSTSSTLGANGYFGAAMKDIKATGGIIQNFDLIGLEAGDMVRIEVLGKQRQSGRVKTPGGRFRFETYPDGADVSGVFLSGDGKKTVADFDLPDHLGSVTLQKIEVKSADGYKVSVLAKDGFYDIMVTVYRKPVAKPVINSSGFYDSNGSQNNQLVQSNLTAPAITGTQEWHFTYDAQGVAGSTFDIEFWHSTDGVTKSASEGTISISGALAADGSHTIDFASSLQTSSQYPFWIAEIDPENALHLDNTSQLLSTSEGIYFDGLNIHVYGSSDPDAVSFSGSAPVRVDSSTVVDGMVSVSLTTNAGTSNAHHYVLDNFTIHVGNPSQVATVADYQYSFGDTDIHTYGGGDYIDTFAAPGFIATVHGGTGDDSLMASGLVFYDINTDMLLGAAKPGEVDLFGQDGDDLLWAADGNNNLYGGLGDDQYRFAEPYSGLVSAYGTVGIFENVGEGQDTVDFNRLLYITSVLTIDLSSTDQQSAGSQFSVTFNDGHTLENLIGTDYDDQLTGNDQDNLIQGGHGNDTIFATTGNDMLYGATQSAPQYLTGDDTFVFSDLVDGAAADQIFAGYDGVQTLDFSPLASRQISLDPTLQGVWQSVIDGQLDLNLQGNFTVNAPTGGITPIVADSSTTDPQTLEGGDGAVFQVDGNQSQVTIQLTSGATNATLQLGAIAQPVLIDIGGQIVQIDAATGNATLNLSVDESGLHIDRFDTFGPSSASTITAHLVSGDAGKLAWLNDSGDTTFTAPDVTTLLPTFDVWSGTLTFSADQHASVVALDGADAHLLLSGTQHIDLLETDDGASAAIAGGTLTVANADRSSLNFEIDSNTAAVVVTSPDGAVWTASNSGTDASHFGFSAFTDGEGNVYDVNITKRGVGNLVEGASGRIANTDTTIARYTTLTVADTDGTHPASGDITLAGDAQTTLDLSGLAAQANVNLNTTGSFQNIIADASLRIKLTGVPGTVVGSMGGGTLTGDGGANHLVATGGTTSLIGGAGNDTLTFMGGDATIDPGSGADTIEVVDPLEGNVWGFVDVYASSGDTLDLSGMSALADVDLAETTVEQTIAANPDDGSQVLTLRLHASPSKLIGSAGGGSLIGTSGNDTLVATGGTTAIDGGNGNDTFIVNGGVANINVVSVAGDTKTILPDVNNSVTHVTSANNSVYIDLKAAGQELVMFRVYGDGNIALTASGDANGRLVVTSTGTAVMYNYYLMAAAGGFDWINRSGGLIYLDAVTSTTIKPNFEISGGSVSFLSPTTVGNIVTDGGGAYIQTTLHADSISVQSGVVYNGSLLLTTHDLHIGQGLFFTGAHGSEGARALVVDHLSMDRDSAGHYIGKLDINNNVLIWHGGGADGMISVVDMLTHNSLFSTWLGHGLGGASTNYTGLGVMQNNNLAFSSTTGMVTSGGTAFYTTFAGQSVGVNDVLVKYTWLGDCDLDGVITAGDYSLIDAAFARQNSIGPVGGWVNGDFDLDGRITAGDYAQIDLSYPHQTGVL